MHALLHRSRRAAAVAAAWPASSLPVAGPCPGRLGRPARRCRPDCRSQQPNDATDRPVVGPRRPGPPGTRSRSTTTRLRQPRARRPPRSNNTYVPTINLSAGTQLLARARPQRRRRRLRPAPIQQSASRRRRSRSRPPPSSGARSSSRRPAAADLDGVPRGDSYTVEVDGDTDFVGATTYTTDHVPRRPRPDWAPATGSGGSSRRKGGDSTRCPALARSFVVAAIEPPAHHVSPDDAEPRAPGRRPRLGAGAGRQVVRREVATNQDFTDGSLTETSAASWARATPRS